MKIDPVVGLVLNFVALLLTGIGAGAVQWGSLDPATVETIKTVAADGLFVLTTANLVFGFYSSTKPGPLSSDKP